MAPRWFRNVKFGDDRTNLPFQDIVENFKNAFEEKLGDITKSTLPDASTIGTGPIIEEVLSEDEDVEMEGGSDEEAPRKEEAEMEEEKEDKTPQLEEEEEAEEEAEVEEEAESEEEAEVEGEVEAEVEEEVEAEVEEEEAGLEAEVEGEVEAEVEEEEAGLEAGLEAGVEAEEEEAEEQLESEAGVEAEKGAEMEAEKDPEEEEAGLEAGVEEEAEVEVEVGAEEDLELEAEVEAEKEEVEEELEAEKEKVEDEKRMPRRSDRNRFKPLDFARGERLKYNIHGDIIGIDQGYPVHNYSRKKQQTQSEVKVPSGATYAGRTSFKDSKKGKFKFACHAFEPNMTAGVLLLPPHGSKSTTQMALDKNYLFNIARGKVLIKVTGKSTKKIFTDEHCFWIRLPHGHKYSFKNCENKPAKILYIVSDRDRLD